MPRVVLWCFVYGATSTTPQQPAPPQYANYWAPLTRRRHLRPQPAQPQRTNHWVPRTRKRHQQEHRPQRPTERSDPTQHAKGRTGDCPGPRKEQRDGMSYKGDGWVDMRPKNKRCVPKMGLSVLALCSEFHFSPEENLFGFGCGGGSAWEVLGLPDQTPPPTRGEHTPHKGSG